ncbi:phosphotransferase [Sphaerimonospora thailandensis]|uniref:Phosphotransferase n=1 Tax=Sphaerimonospora thailandensis TaxID=795644 RepID=A0A8J3RA40_9ACTN|nr:phosphotransferase [Sphaerimonospora thailandensis]GIH70725.1 phosphotransferase [Sphaerimonospora thailandensis]
MRGGVNEVRRVGSTVHRPTGPWSPAVHGLLRHLERQGFGGAPRLYGVTDDGMEILDFIPGQVGEYPLTTEVASSEALESAAELLAAYHDATVGYVTGHETGWMMPAPAPAEVILHNDYAPYNCVLDGTRVVGIIDFDTAAPGPRLWDVAYAVYRWAPTTAPGNGSGFGTAEEQAARARVFCDRYGLDAAGRSALVDTITARLTALVDFMHTRAAAGEAAFRCHIEEGHDRLYRDDIAYLEERPAVFEAALLHWGGQDVRAGGAGRTAARVRAGQGVGAVPHSEESGDGPGR